MFGLTLSALNASSFRMPNESSSRGHISRDFNIDIVWLSLKVSSMKSDAKNLIVMRRWHQNQRSHRAAAALITLHGAPLRLTIVLSAFSLLALAYSYINYVSIYWFFASPNCPCIVEKKQGLANIERYRPVGRRANARRSSRTTR